MRAAAIAVCDPSGQVLCDQRSDLIGSEPFAAVSRPLSNEIGTGRRLCGLHGLHAFRHSQVTMLRKNGTPGPRSASICGRLNRWATRLTNPLASGLSASRCEPTLRADFLVTVEREHKVRPIET